MTTFRHLIGRTVTVDGRELSISLWQKYQHKRAYINAPGCRRTDYVDLRTGELCCSPTAQRLIAAALRQRHQAASGREQRQRHGQREPLPTRDGAPCNYAAPSNENLYRLRPQADENNDPAGRTAGGKGQQ